MSKGTEKIIRIRKAVGVIGPAAVTSIMARIARNDNERAPRSLAQNLIVPQKKFGLYLFVANSYSFTNTLSDKIFLLIFNS